MAKPLHERIETRIDTSDAGICWIWPGSTTSKTWKAYGTISKYQHMDGSKSVYKILLTHRVMYEHYKGPIPEGFDVDHLCRVRLCCNPDHLEAVTRTENSHRGAKYRPTHCKNGHEYTEDNSRYTKQGHIRCYACSKIHAKRTREKRNGSVRSR